MFRGLYLIINVSHSIKPNGMTTTFKGVRVKKTKTPLLTASDVLMNLIGDVSNVDTGTSTLGGSKIGTPAPFRTSNFGFKTIVNKFLTGGGNQDSKDSLEGFKSVPELYKNNELTPYGKFMVSIGAAEGLGSSPACKNPGNITGGNCGKDKRFKQYDTWKDGWYAAYEYFKLRVNGNVPNSAGRVTVNNYIEESNDTFTKAGIDFYKLNNYKYTNGSPTLRQYINIYAPWGDGSNNPANYIAGVAVQLKTLNNPINIDEPLNKYFK